MSTGAVGGASSATNNAAQQNDGQRGLKMDDFLKLMITEMQNQDPLNPLENHQILQQISQMREIEASDQLKRTLENVLLGQNLVSASAMIGKHIAGLTESNEEVTGVVERVSIDDSSSPRLHVGDHVLRLRNVRAILPGEQPAPDAPDPGESESNSAIGSGPESPQQPTDPDVPGIEESIS